MFVYSLISFILGFTLAVALNQAKKLDNSSAVFDLHFEEWLFVFKVPIIALALISTLETFFYLHVPIDLLRIGIAALQVGSEMVSMAFLVLLIIASSRHYKCFAISVVQATALVTFVLNITRFFWFAAWWGEAESFLGFNLRSISLGIYLVYFLVSVADVLKVNQMSMKMDGEEQKMKKTE